MNNSCDTNAMPMQCSCDTHAILIRTSREGNSPTAEVNTICHTDVFVSLPLLVLLLPTSSTDTVPMLGMFSRPVRNSQAEALASNSAETYVPYRRTKTPLTC